MNRDFDVTLSAVVTATSVSVTPPTGELRLEGGAATGRLEAAGFRLLWERLSEGGAWMLRVYVEGELVDIAVHDDPETVILAVADRLLPPSSE
jgi:hypothetical protein